MKFNDKLVFGIVLLLLVGIVGLNIYVKEATKGGGLSELSTRSSSTNLLTGAAVGTSDLAVQTTANCWQYTSIANGCTADNGCKWRNDSWNSNGWCEELNCWSLYSQSDCANTAVPGKNCTWQGSSTFYTCDKVSCWSFSGTNANSCVNNSLNLACNWDNYCYTSAGNAYANCWQYQNQSACANVTGCSWGQCMEKGCWSYNTEPACKGGKDWNGRNCTWDSTYSYCQENGCWRYSNQSTCPNSTGGLNCEWKWNSCQEKDCWSWDFTNSSACINNTANISCSWDGSYCDKQDCWSYNTNATCSQQPNCNWKAYASSGWCNEVNCWTWDSMSGGNRSSCVNNTYSLACIWSGNPPGNNTNGWCYKDVSTVGCSNKTTERDCMDTMYCWWQYTNWSNPSAGGNCSTPGAFGAGTSNTIQNSWNPGCYIFDFNVTDCNNTLGCNHTGTVCAAVPAHANYNEIIANGINCSMINDSTLCNGIPALSSCCAWQNGSCAANKISTACWDQMQQKTEDNCEDADTSTRCQQIAGSPWYMPCQWENSTSNCKLKAEMTLKV
ncbi:hypothetical protein HZC32_02695 [Candidatus Woesearchaeota archaeon]|nr:hypothetical protein [Candidatus Woesearchaeota archaeon]